MTKRRSEPVDEYMAFFSVVPRLSHIPSWFWGTVATIITNSWTPISFGQTVNSGVRVAIEKSLCLDTH